MCAVRVHLFRPRIEQFIWDGSFTLDEQITTRYCYELFIESHTKRPNVPNCNEFVIFFFETSTQNKELWPVLFRYCAQNFATI